MKRSRKRLSLNRETLHQLIPGQLREVAGGNTREIVTSCMATKLCGTTGCGSVGCGTLTCPNTINSCTLQFVGCCTA
jgi:hypothetical protein